MRSYADRDFQLEKLCNCKGLIVTKIFASCIVISSIFLTACSGYSPAEEHDIDMCFTSFKYGFNESDAENCEVVTKSKNALEELALKIVREKLKDPHSAIFEDIKVYDDVVWGKVNAKNGFGAYGGFTTFSLRYENGVMKFDM